MSSFRIHPDNSINRTITIIEPGIINDSIIPLANYSMEYIGIGTVKDAAITTGFVLSLVESQTVFPLIYSELYIHAVSVSNFLWTGAGNTRKIGIWELTIVDKVEVYNKITEIIVSKTDILLNDYYTVFLDDPLLLTYSAEKLFVIGCLCEPGDSNSDSTASSQLVQSQYSNNNIIFYSPVESSPNDTLSVPEIDSTLSKNMCNVLIKGVI